MKDCNITKELIRNLPMDDAIRKTWRTIENGAGMPVAEVMADHDCVSGFREVVTASILKWFKK